MTTVRDLETNNPGKLLSRIATEFPSLSWKNHTFLNHGWDHEVLILDNKIVFRFPNSSEYAGTLKEEIQLLKFLSKKVDANIPVYKYIAEHPSFAGYDIIPGTELSEVVFARLSDKEKDNVARQVAEFLKQLHTIDLKSLRAFNIEQSDMPTETQRLKKQSKEFLTDKLTQDEFAQLTAVLNELETFDYSQIPNVLVHNDVSPSHIFWDKKSQHLGVIDFSDRCIGDPAFDFAELVQYGDNFLEKVYEYYGGPKDEDFLRRSRIYMRRVGVYLLVDCFVTKKLSFDESKKIFDRVIML